jgi:hypothetical protein
LNISLHVGEEIQRLQQDLHEHVFLLRGGYLLTKTSLTPPHFIKVSVPDGQTDRWTDGHGEISILPYNFVVGGITKDRVTRTPLKLEHI